jgi:hypothetical protein
MVQKNKQNREKGGLVIPFLIAAGIFGLLGAGGWYLALPLAEKIGWFFFTLLFVILGTISTAFASFTSWILQNVISPGFTSLSYTKPYGPNANPVIDAGLSVTQGFANMILVLVLVFIAVAVILRLAGYETKKLLPTFILVALLVNFAPVVVGLVVDAANIIMNYFLRNLWQFAVLSAELSNLWGSLNMLGTTIDETRSNFFYAASVAVFGFFLGVAYLVYALVFIVRYVAIWALTILSPLAFVLYILPATRHLAKKWWEQLVQWSFIGVTAAFFLYLASHVVAGARDWFVVQTAGSPQADTISILLVYLVPLVFLYLGLALGMATSAMGATVVIKGSLRAQRWSARQGLVGARAGLRRLISSERAERWGLKERLERQAAARFMPERLRQMAGVGGLAARVGYYAAAPITATAWAVRRGVGETTLRMKEADEADITKAEGQYKGTNVERKLAAMRDVRLGWAHRIAALRAAIEDEEIGDLRRLGVSDEEITNIGRAALRVHPDMFKKIRDAFPQLAQQIGDGFGQGVRLAAGLEFQNNQEFIQYNGNIAARILAQMRPDRIGKMNWRAAFDDPAHGAAIEAAVHRFWAPEQLKAALRAHGRGFADRFHEGIENNLQQDPNWYDNNNAPLGRYLSSTPARDLGVGI